MNAIWISFCVLVALMWICPTIVVVVAGVTPEVYIASVISTVAAFIGICNFGD